jgi:hypothetical protein
VSISFRRSCRDCDALNADELETLLGRAFDFKTQLDRLANALRYLVKRPRLSMASRELRDSVWAGPATARAGQSQTSAPSNVFHQRHESVVHVHLLMAVK